MNFFDFSFWQNFASNLIATVVGVALGIPVAFWIDRRVQMSTEREKTKKIVRLLKEDLLENQKVLTEWQKVIEEGQHEKEGIYRASGHAALVRRDARLRVMGMRDENWRAFSDGGELQWINDPILLGLLADAYGGLSRLRTLVFEADYMIMDENNSVDADHYTWEKLKEFVLAGLQSIEDVLLYIDLIVEAKKK